jgi:hypothetical protein
MSMAILAFLKILSSLRIPFLEKREIQFRKKLYELE